MKVIIAGSRTVQSFEHVEAAVILSEFTITQVVCGCARGGDALGRQWAVKNLVDLKYFPANWDRDGMGAGYLRNKQMAEYADALIALLRNSSHGTLDMIRLMQDAKKPVYIYEVLKP